MSRIYYLLTFFISLLFYSCDKTATTQPPIVPAKVYNYDTFVYAGYSSAHYLDIISGNTTTWDSTILNDTLVVKVDSAQDHIMFSMNSKNPFGVYPEYDYEFDISSNYFRKNFVQNFYQSFYFEGDSLKSYFYRLQLGGNSSYQKEIRFAGAILQ